MIYVEESAKIESAKVESGRRFSVEECLEEECLEGKSVEECLTGDLDEDDSEVDDGSHRTLTQHPHFSASSFQLLPPTSSKWTDIRSLSSISTVTATMSLTVKSKMLSMEKVAIHFRRES